MNYQERLQKMVAAGALSADQATAFEKSLGSLPPQSLGASVKKPLPIAVLGVSAAAILTIGAWALSGGGAVAPEAVQNVAQAINQPGTTGNVGTGFAAGVVLFMLAGVPSSLLALVVASAYNDLVLLDEEAQKTAAFVAAALQRCRDSLPQLESVVERALSFEETMQASVAGMRKEKAEDLKEALSGMAQDQETDMMGAAGQALLLAPKLSALVEAYPDIKSHLNILSLQDELSRVETELMVARNMHSAAVAELNARARSLSGSLAARISGVRSRPYFAAGETA